MPLHRESCGKKTALIDRRISERAANLADCLERNAPFLRVDSTPAGDFVRITPEGRDAIRLWLRQEARLGEERGRTRELHGVKKSKRT